MTAIQNVDTLVHRLVQQTTQHSSRDVYMFLVVTGLAMHTGAFGISMMMIPKYAAEGNPVPVFIGPVPYFLVTVAIFSSIYYLVWRNRLMSSKEKIFIVSIIAGLSFFDFIHDFGFFVNVVRSGGFS